MRVEDEYPDVLLTVQGVARRLCVHPSTVRRWIQQGDLEAVLLPHHGKRQAYRIRPDALERLLLAHEQRSTQPQSSTTKEESL